MVMAWRQELEFLCITILDAMKVEQSPYLPWLATFTLSEIINKCTFVCVSASRNIRIYMCVICWPCDFWLFCSLALTPRLQYNRFQTYRCPMLFYFTANIFNCIRCRDTVYAACIIEKEAMSGNNKIKISLFTAFLKIYFLWSFAWFTFLLINQLDLVKTYCSGYGHHLHVRCKKKTKARKQSFNEKQANRELNLW